MTMMKFSKFAGKRIFLAAPYTCQDTLLRNYRVSQINACAAELMLAGAVVFSPVSMLHPVSYFTHEPQEHDFWLRQSLSFLEWTEVFVVLQMQGWDKSRGVKQELAKAKSLGLDIIYLDNLCGQTRKGEGYD